jgi:cation transport regulator ChaB
VEAHQNAFEEYKTPDKRCSKELSDQTVAKVAFAAVEIKYEKDDGKRGVKSKSKSSSEKS